MADDVQRTLGVLLAKVENIEKTLAKGDEHRAVVHRRVDDLVEDVGDLKAKVIAVESTVRDAKAVTDEVTRWKLMGMGALGVTGVAAASLASLVTYYWHKIVAAITG